MTDNEIVKAWGSCLKDNVDCAKCPLIHEDCHETILDLINRQKAEIERLKRKLVGYEPSIDSGLFSQMLLEQKEKAEAFEKKWKAEVKAEAYREVVKWAKENAFRADSHKDGFEYDVVDIDDIDDFLKKLVGEDDG